MYMMDNGLLMMKLMKDVLRVGKRSGSHGSGKSACRAFHRYTAVHKDTNREIKAI